MTVDPKDIQAVAAWLFRTNSVQLGSGGYYDWNGLAQANKNRWIFLAKRLISKPPPELLKYLKEENARNIQS